MKAALQTFEPTPAHKMSVGQAFQTLGAAPAVIALITVTTILHVIAAGAVGLGNDEAYTVANARIISLSYVDYPPLHVWLVGTWAAVVHSEAPLVVRLPFIAFFAGSTWLMYELTALLFGQRSGFWAALTFNIAPVYAIAHSSWVLPDGPLTFFMLAGAFLIARQVWGANSYQHQFANWIGIGVVTGVGVLTKYHAAFLVTGTFAFLLSFRAGRRLLHTSGPWVALGTAFVIFLPVLSWNATHEWLGLFFQSARLTKHTGLSATRVLANIGGQAAYLSPWLFVPLTLVLYRALRQGPRSQKTWYLAMLACGPILFFTGASFFAKGLPHWSMPGWLFAFPLLGYRLSDWERLRPRAVRGLASVSITLTACLLAAFVGETRFGWITANATMQSAEHNPTLDLLDWQDLSVAIQERHLIDSATPAIAGTSWMTAGKLNYVIGRNVPVLCLCADPQQFRFLHDPGIFVGRNVIIVQTPWQYEHDAATLRKSFKRLELLPPVTLERHGNHALELIILRGREFDPVASRGART